MAQAAKRVLVATMKDEGPFILEWLAYHHLIGFDHFVVYSNDCWDQTPDILQMVGDRIGLVSYFDNSLQEKRRRADDEHHDPQRRAYQRAWKLPIVQNADYVMVLDADEFLNIHTGDGTLDALFEATSGFDAMSITWRLFGRSGRVVFEDAPVLEQFTQCRADTKPVEVRKWGVKTLFRPHRIQKLGVHRPYHLRPVRSGEDPIRWLNGSGEDVYERYRESHWCATPDTHGARLAEINHYSIKSSEAFLMKKRRGSANSTDADRIGREYLDLYDQNEVEDRSIQRHLPQVRTLMAEWFNAYPDLAELHASAVFFHKAIATQLVEKLKLDSPEFVRELGIT